MSPIVVPAPIFRLPDGELDQVTNARYAAYIAGTWVRHVVVAGPVGAGETCTTTQRMALVDLWADHIDHERLIVACWEPHEIERTLDRRMRPLVMLRSDTDEQLLATLADLPRDTIAYTNPRYSRTLITAALIDQARGALPRSVKFSKVVLDDLADARAAGGPDLQIIHGSSRNITRSIAVGVDMVVSSPLAALPHPWPASALDAVQRSADQVQRILDTRHDHGARVEALVAMARCALAVA